MNLIIKFEKIQKSSKIQSKIYRVGKSRFTVVHMESNTIINI